ncbi:MAG: sulfotransferase [Parafilimonas sp.]
MIKFIKKAYRHIYKKTISRIYFNTNKDINKTVFLASLGRSGSTLVAELINYNNRFRIIFEPFKPGKLKDFKNIHYPTYIIPNEDSSAIYNKFKKVFEGNIRNAWTDSQNKKLICTYKLIKDIYANMMLGYISQNFPEMSIIVLLRNPYPVIESWKRVNWGVHNIKERILQQENTIKTSLPEGALELLKSSNDHFTINMHIWCITYYISFHQLRNRKYYCLFYENFLTDPEKEIHKLFNFLKLKFNGNIKKLMRKESAMTRSDSPLRNGENILLSWKKHYSDADLATGNDILKFYGLDNLYDFENTFLPSKAINF